MHDTTDTSHPSLQTSPPTSAALSGTNSYISAPAAEMPFLTPGVPVLFSAAAATPAQRAAEAALFDSPLRPISCPTWPGFLPMLPASLEPTFYRMRDTTPAAAEVSTDDVAADVVYSNSSKAQAAPVTVQPSSSSAATQVATTATALATLGVFVAPGAAGLLPVVLVTSGSAAAGLLLAASIAGVAGLVDKRRGGFALGLWWRQLRWPTSVLVFDTGSITCVLLARPVLTVGSRRSPVCLLLARHVTQY